MPPLLLWAQQGPPLKVPGWLQWCLIWGEPALTDARAFGGFITWAKILGLFCLLGWVLAQVLNALRPDGPVGPRGRGPDNRRSWIVLGILVGLGLGAMLLQVLDQSERLKLGRVGGVSVATGLTYTVAGAFVLALEGLLWTRAARSGRRGVTGMLLALHVALAFGFFVSFYSYRFALGLSGAQYRSEAFISGWRVGATYMGLAVLVGVLIALAGEVASVRWRRIYSIAWQTVVESYRRMWAPWVVLAVFVVVLAFVHWFLGSGRTAELARLFVGALALMSSLLLLVMILMLAPISIPNDIRQQTIYTVVTKPVRRLELVWGRLLGYMGLVTVLLVLFGGVSLVYLNRVVGGRIALTRAAADKAETQGRAEEAQRFREQADQLETRMSARVPVYGSLVFTDSKGTPRAKGIDVGTEMTARSHVEGATPSKATWRFGVVADPFEPTRQVDRRIPIDALGLLVPGTIEAVEDRIAILEADKANSDAYMRDPRTKPADLARAQATAREADATLPRLNEELAGLRRQEQDLKLRARKSEADGRAEEARDLGAQAAALHSPDIPLEMTFNVYRTTKGELGKAVDATLEVVDPRTNRKLHRDLFGVHEYYTIRRPMPASVLVGTGGNLLIEVRCITPNQYLGMAERDLFILARQGSFATNYLRGLAGIWLQAMVLTAIGLFAGSFLSWPVALLTTLAFFIAGQVAVSFLQQFALAGVLGGGPFESAIRLITHQNQVNELDPTAAVIVAKLFDGVAMPVLSRLVYFIPNLAALDLSETVAEGFAVDNSMLFGHILLGLGYALPFSVAAYLILKRREVAA